PPISTLFPYTTLFRSQLHRPVHLVQGEAVGEQWCRVDRSGEIGGGLLPGGEHPASDDAEEGEPLHHHVAAEVEGGRGVADAEHRSEEHTSELQSPCNL